MTNPNALPSTQEVQSAFHRMRNTRVALAEVLARLSGKSVSAFNQAVSIKAASIVEADHNPCPRSIGS